MNASFDPFDLVNTYGAFGSVGRERYEIVLEGTADDPQSPSARWLEYEFPCKPGRTDRRPCWISPYHYRLDWQMWFLAMPGAGTDPWFVHLVAKLLDGDAQTRRLLSPGPFMDQPPRAIRALYYRYEMTRLGEAHARLLEADARGNVSAAAHARRPAAPWRTCGPGAGTRTGRVLMLRRHRVAAALIASTLASPAWPGSTQIKPGDSKSRHRDRDRGPSRN